MRSPSSLIFLVLLGVWAAYFVQYRVRRRDHIATARSVEQFTQAMRVLERRDPLPRTDLSEQAPRSYAVHPARANRPQVLVKRAVAAEHAAPLTVTARVAGAGGTGAPIPRPVRDRSGRPERIVPVRPRLRPSRRVRGLIVLASLAELVVIVPLVVLSMLPVWGLATAGLTLVAAVAYLRSGVRAEQAMMRAHRRRQADLARLRSSAPVTASVGRRTSPAHSEPARTATVAATASGAVDGSATVADAESVTAQAHPVDAEAAPAPLDVALEAAPAGGATASLEAPVVAAVVPADVMVPIVDEDDMPLTWDPVPVPRPTYTMKAKAERREVAPAAVTPDPPRVVREEQDEDTAYDQRRVAGA